MILFLSVSSFGTSKAISFAMRESSVIGSINCFSSSFWSAFIFNKSVSPLSANFFNKTISFKVSFSFSNFFVILAHFSNFLLKSLLFSLPSFIKSANSATRNFFFLYFLEKSRIVVIGFKAFSVVSCSDRSFFLLNKASLNKVLNSIISSLIFHESNSKSIS